MKRLRTLLIALTSLAAITTLPIVKAADETAIPAPNFTLKSLSGENIKLNDLRGEVVMINFWASWCGPCRQEMPLLERLYKRYQPMGFTLLGVNVEEDSQMAINWLKDTPVTFPILFDRENEVSEKYHVIAMPTTLLLDRDGNIRFIHQGYQPGVEKAYKRQIRELLKE